MKLIIDCGSTKADWVILKGDDVVESFTTDGFNPNYTDKDTISSIILNEPSYKPYVHNITNVIFYGSGCGNIENCNFLKDILSSIFICSKVEVTHDMMAACHAVSGNKNGIVCILGTGSNSCLYDGKQIVDKTVSLGYMLGDEGSGSHLGKTLLRDYFYGNIPKELAEKFKKEYRIELRTFVDNVYHKSHCSKYLASFSRYISENIGHDYMKSVCHKCFNEFINCHITRYENFYEYEISFVGSIAYYFQDILKECLEDRGLKLGKVLKSPIEGLIKYHRR